MQSALLQYSWVDISFILDCTDSWAQRFAKNRFFRHHKIWGNPGILHQWEDDSGGFGSFKSARHYFQHDYDAFCTQTDHDSPPLQAGSSWLEVHHETNIPDELLTGPWNEAATQKLFWLVRAGARLSHDQTWETTLEGYHNATRSSTASNGDTINLPVVRLLLTLGGDHWPKYVADSELQKLQDMETTLRDKGQIEAYRKYACIAAMLLRVYSNANSTT